MIFKVLISLSFQKDEMQGQNKCCPSFQKEALGGPDFSIKFMSFINFVVYVLL